MKEIDSPSDALASPIVTSALSSSLIVPVPVSVAVTPDGALDTARSTWKVSSASSTASPVVDTVKVSVSPAVPVKVSAVVFSS